MGSIGRRITVRVQSRQKHESLFEN
jgi:hypothetical protein